MRSVVKDPYIDYKLVDVRSSDKEFNESMQYKQQYYPDLEDKTSDLFTGFMKDFEWNKECNVAFKKFIESSLETDDFKELKSRTKNNEYMSWIATKDLQSSIQELQEEQKLPQDESLKGMQNFLKDRLNADRMRSYMRKAMMEANEEVKENEEILKIAGYSPTGKGANEQLDFKQIQTLVEFFKKSNNYKKIIDQIGRMRSISNETQKTRTIFSEDEIVGIELGNDIEKVCIEEFAKDRRLFIMDYMEGCLQQTMYEGRDPFGLGPIIYCIDESGSMNNDRIIEAKSIMFALYGIAKKAKRPFYVIRFDEDIVEHHIEKETDMIDILQSFLGGGTDFEKPLMKSCEIIENHIKFKKADVLFVTDGQAQISSDVTNRIEKIKKKVNFKIIGICLGYGELALSQFCDRYYNRYEMDQFLKEAFSV